MFGGKMKALTFSFDDAVRQDVKMIEILNKYGLKGTFNLNSGRLGMEGTKEWEGRKINTDKIKPEDIKYVYEGHEISSHTVDHPGLVLMEDDEVIRQVEECRLALSDLAGYEVVGFAYPGGKWTLYDERVKNLVKDRTGCKYARITLPTLSYDLPEDLFELRGTACFSRNFDDLLNIGQKFLELKTDKPQLFYLWGHGYELDMGDGRWEVFEEFCKMMGGHDDIFYGTNAEVLL